MRIKMMEDHYAVLADDVVIGCITRSTDPASPEWWMLSFIDGNITRYGPTFLENCLHKATERR